MKHKPPTLTLIDLTQCFKCKGSCGEQDHHDIHPEKTYLAKIRFSTDRKAGFFAGSFSRQWYGLSFDGWGGGGGLQLDKPGTNCSPWRGLWEIVP